MGVSTNLGIQNGWFISWKTPSRNGEMDDDWGYPHDSGHLHMINLFRMGVSQSMDYLGNLLFEAPHML